ncbi:uncharacterized protein A4U43_C07F24860 [Asparagus officinalis]|uniref:Uncharacterized protein n=1 Tax=Asparagus officinalis TaxID=4686 RepID=A0A5P1EEP3_ASPOF|nr:uncharacterized protein A4U43_C07F24860 [Asparagus officinalis]
MEVDVETHILKDGSSLHTANSDVCKEPIPLDDEEEHMDYRHDDTNDYLIEPDDAGNFSDVGGSDDESNFATSREDGRQPRSGRSGGDPGEGLVGRMRKRSQLVVSGDVCRCEPAGSALGQSGLWLGAAEVGGVRADLGVRTVGVSGV